MKVSFGERLRRLRMERNISQQKLSNMLHVDRSTIAKWESGARQPDVDMIARLSDCLSAEPGLLLQASEKNAEKWNVMLVDDEKIILSGALSVLSEALPEAEIHGFTDPAAAFRAALSHGRADMIDMDSTIDLSLLIDPVLMLHLLCCCEESPRRSPALYTICAIRASQFILGIICDVTRQSEITTLEAAARSPLMLLYFALGIVLTVAELVIVIRRRKKLTMGQWVIFLVLFVLPHPWCILFLELFLMQEQNRRYLRQKEELAREKTRVAVMQMRPHFIYNTLISIYYLCQEDVEKARFEDKLYVEFDTPVTVFKLPPLTLQPIVGNAVKHGISPNLDPLYLTIATEDTGEGVKLTVEDTGPGFDPSDDDEPHITLDNIRQRLKAMCGGSLEIEEREAGGTRVTIFIPFDGKRQNG